MQRQTTVRQPMWASLSSVEGNGCTAYDVIVSDIVYSEIEARKGMREFVAELALSQVEAKNDLALDRGMSGGYMFNKQSTLCLPSARISASCLSNHAV